ncbi:unnamed protein product, partial [Vitis vinifera]
MLKRLAPGLLISSLLISASAVDNSFPRCNCEDEGFWSVENILECQKVSDFLIAVAYFSIPIELLYFVSCSNVPFKWVLFQFIAFIVLCGLTHLLNGWTYGPHPFQLMLALTIFKFLTALVSCATAITLITLIPLLLKVKVREFMLKKKTWDLGREVGIIKKKKEAGLHVRMLTHEIRKSLDRHTILHTTLVELSNTLDLQNCAVWMPNENKTEMNLTHDSGTSGEPGPVAAIRMPMLRVSNFKGGTPELVQACYSILVLVLKSGQARSWTSQELDIVKVVADQVAVAVSHAAVLEESQLMRDQLAEQNRALQQAKRNAMMASQARNSFQKVMSDGMRRPMHSISGLLSMMQDEKLNTKCLCVYRGFGFAIEVEKSLPDHVIGEERRVFQVILHMVGNLLNGTNGGGSVTFRVLSETGSQGRHDQRWATWKSNSSDGYVYIKFEIGINNADQQTSDQIDEGLSFTMCRRLAQLMQGNIWLVPNPQGFAKSMALVLRFQLQPSIGINISEPGESSEHPHSNSLFRGLQVLLADDDDTNRAVTRKLLEKLGCIVSVVSSGFECLGALGPAASSFQIVLLDLHMPELDGFEVAMRIRKFRSRSWPLIVALTASADEDVWERCLEIGMNGASKSLAAGKQCCVMIEMVSHRSHDSSKWF